MLVDGGTTRQTGSSTHLGLSSGGTFAAGSSSHRSVGMTDLARRFQPPTFPQRDRTAQLLGLIVLGVGCLGILSVLSATKDLEPAQFFAGIGVWLCVAAPGAGLLYIYDRGGPAHAAKVRKWRTVVDYLDNAWLCHRCGHDWAPNVD